MHYLIYLPGVSGMVGDVSLTKRGGGDLLRGGGWRWIPVAGTGPDRDGHGSGLIGFHGNDQGKFNEGVDTTEWTWYESPPCDNYGYPPADPDKPQFAGGGYWVGIHKTPLLRPLPEELARPEMLEGCAVRLRDGNQWIVPAADYLPKYYGLDPRTGSMVARLAGSNPELKEYAVTTARFAQAVFDMESSIEVIRKVHATSFAELDKEDQELLKTMIDDETGGPVTKGTTSFRTPVELVDALKHAQRGLRFNYRVNAFVMDCLELLDDAGVQAIVMASMDIPLIRESLKKNAVASPISIPAGFSM